MMGVLNYLENNFNSPLNFAQLFCPRNQWKVFDSKFEVLFPEQIRFSLASLRPGYQTLRKSQSKKDDYPGGTKDRVIYQNSKYIMEGVFSFHTSHR